MNPQRVGISLFFSLLVVFGFLGLSGVIDSTALFGLLLIISSVMGLVLLSRNILTGSGARGLSMEERIHEASLLRVARERERAFYDMTTLLSSTLESHKILDAVQDLGEMVTRESSRNTRLVSAALLFQNGRGNLHVANSRGLNAQDEKQTVPGKEGIVGLALHQADPVFGGMPSRDPELQYFAAFYDCKSVLAIPLRAGYDYYGVLVFGSANPNAFSEDYVELLKAIGTQAAIALQNAVLYGNILEEKNRIVEVEEDARKKLARDLHDGPTQSIAAIAMRINYIRRLVGEQAQQAFEELGKVEDLARRTTKEIRHMLFTLRPLILETQGLVAALGQLSEKMYENYDQHVVIEAQPGIERWLDSNAQGTVFYIIEEAVNNARKYAQAQQITVRLYHRESYFIVEIEDNGVGFNVDAVSGNYESRGSLGMVNMRERSEMVEGTLHLSSKEGVGTKVSVLIPLREKAIMASQRPEAGADDREKDPPTIRRISRQPEESPKRNIPHATKRSPSS